MDTGYLFDYLFLIGAIDNSKIIFNSVQRFSK